ncbi:uncharacterized protein [Leptinotarsa decemlineata]|uniref:uncharacterized protein n=1 Tax=Leptinotarsa decemlineata TaxID=7539 RepID=UPI003D306069
MSFTNSNMKIVDSNLVEKILEQGQKLRNAMIGSILKNDPFSTEILINNHYNTPRSSRSELSNNTKTENVIPLNDKRLEAFIKGDCMSKEEEKLALDTLRSLSAPDLCETTERTLKSTNIGGCKCYICKVYNSKYLSCDSKLNSQKEMEFQSPPQHEVTENIPGKYKACGVQTLKFVDSLKIAINNLILNDIGNQKILSTVNSKVPCKSSSNFFLEYKVPEILVTSAKHKSKVDSGLETNHVRLSSRKTSNVINFKQVTIHDIKSLDKVDLENCEIDFKRQLHLVIRKLSY